MWAPAPLFQVALAEIVEVIEVGEALPAESAPPRFVTASRVGARTPDVCLVIRLGSTSSFTGAGCGEDSRDDTRQPIGRVVDILCRGAEADPCGPGDLEDDSASTAAVHRQGGRRHRVQVVQVHRQGGLCPTWCRSCRFHKCSSWRGRSRLKIAGKIVEIPEIRTVQGVQTCERLSTALVRHVAQAEFVEIGEGRPRMATGSSTDGPRVVHGRREVLNSSRPRMVGVQKQGGGDVALYIKMAARAASSRLVVCG